jgi:GTP-binding protein
VTQYDPQLAKRPEIVVLSQADRTEVRDAYPELKAAFAERFGVELQLVSAATRFQLDDLLEAIARRLPARTALEPVAVPNAAQAAASDPEPVDATPEPAAPVEARATPPEGAVGPSE